MAGDGDVVAAAGPTPVQGVPNTLFNNRAPFAGGRGGFQQGFAHGGGGHSQEFYAALDAKMLRDVSKLLREPA